MRTIRNLLRDASLTLKEMLVGILCWSLLIGLIFIWFVDSKLSFVFSLAAGTLAAAAMAFHINAAVETAVELPEGEAGRYMSRQAALRFALLIILVAAVYFLGGNVIAVFGGLLTLKFGAYVQPLVHRILPKILRKEERR